MRQTRILFVCLGNICRSPLAHGVMLKLVAERGMESHVAVDSCGTGEWHLGEPAHRGSCKVAKQNGVDLSFHRARKFSPADWDKFNWIVAMDRENKKTLDNLRGNRTAKVVLLREFEPAGADSPDVPDPYYTGGFEEVYAIVERCCTALLDAVTGPG